MHSSLVCPEGCTGLTEESLVFDFYKQVFNHPDLWGNKILFVVWLKTHKAYFFIFLFYIFTKRETAVCAMSSHISSVTMVFFVCCSTCRSSWRVGGWGAISLPDFLLINPGEWQGWHSLIPRLREAPGILVPSKHRKLPRLQLHYSLIPTHNPKYMKFPILLSTEHNT